MLPTHETHQRGHIDRSGSCPENHKHSVSKSAVLQRQSQNLRTPDGASQSRTTANGPLASVSPEWMYLSLQDVKKIAQLLHSGAPQDELERAVVNGVNRRFYGADVPEDVVDVRVLRCTLRWRFLFRFVVFALPGCGSKGFCLFFGYPPPAWMPFGTLDLACGGGKGVEWLNTQAAVTAGELAGSASANRVETKKHRDVGGAYCDAPSRYSSWSPLVGIALHEVFRGCGGGCGFVGGGGSAARGVTCRCHCSKIDLFSFRFCAPSFCLSPDGHGQPPRGPQSFL